MVRVRKRISIARDNWPTTLIHCAARWTKERRDAMVNNKASSKVNNRANNKVSSKLSNKEKKASRDNPDSKARKVVNRMDANNRVAVRMAVNHKPEENAAVLIVRERWAATGAIIGNCPPRSANVCVKRRICDASGAQVVWAPAGSMK